MIDDLSLRRSPSLPRRSAVEQRVGVLAVALAREPGFEADAAAARLAEAAEGSRSPIERTIARLQADGFTSRPGPIAERALDALRAALVLVSRPEATTP
ncbi:MAG: hypothetical protein M3404_02225 [Actinomycetota bacterium]|nr:hypothetical protein [Actinomycetota bacterium]